MISEFNLEWFRSIDYEDSDQLAERCWIFLNGENKDTITVKKEAFLHEVGAMFESMGQHYEKEIKRN